MIRKCPHNILEWIRKRIRSLKRSLENWKIKKMIEFANLKLEETNFDMERTQQRLDYLSKQLKTNLPEKPYERYRSEFFEIRRRISAFYGRVFTLEEILSELERIK